MINNGHDVVAQHFSPGSTVALKILHPFWGGLVPYEGMPVQPDLLLFAEFHEVVHFPEIKALPAGVDKQRLHHLFGCKAVVMRQGSGPVTLLVLELFGVYGCADWKRGFRRQPYHRANGLIAKSKGAQNKKQKNC